MKGEIEMQLGESVIYNHRSAIHIARMRGKYLALGYEGSDYLAHYDGKRLLVDSIDDRDRTYAMQAEDGKIFWMKQVVIDNMANEITIDNWRG